MPCNGMKIKPKKEKTQFPAGDSAKCQKKTGKMKKRCYIRISVSARLRLFMPGTGQTKAVKGNSILGNLSESKWQS